MSTNRILMIVAAACLIAAAGLFAYTSMGGKPEQVAVTETPSDASPAETVDFSHIQDMALGNPDAAVTVIEYASFTCPHCADFHKGTFKDLKRDYIDTGKINFIHREVYFERFGLWGSMIARCGGEMRYFGIVDRIYGTLSQWYMPQDPAQTAQNLRTIGLTAGLSPEQLDACLNDNDEANALVAWFGANATEHGIDATPSFVINGEKYSNMGYAEFQKILDEKLGG